MLNGKFYTGLPPKMVERQGVSAHNRQESHFFWPDDTRVDSAVETRVKRRGSLQQETAPRVVQRLSSIQNEGSPDVDTRQMFHKEFAKSSIQFYDNLQPNGSSSSSSHQQSRLNRTRREVTPKLTDLEPERRQLPTIKTMDEDAGSERRKQAYSSKIQFYDYVNLNEADTTQNNTRRPKMDMNNKREVELNSKNSPKLQVKHNVRHLSVEREQLPPTLRAVTKKPLNDGPHWERESPSRHLQPKKILKPQRQQAWIEDYYDESGYMDSLDSGMRQLRLRSPAPFKKHVTYNEQADEYAYYDDRSQPEAEAEPEMERDREREPAEGRQLRHSRSQPNMRTGSGQRRQHEPEPLEPYVETGRDIKSLNNYNKNSHNNYNYNSEYNHNNKHNNTNTNVNKNNSNSRKMLPKSPEPMRTMRSRRSDDTRASSATTTTTTTTTTSSAEEVSVVEQPSPSDPRKHLRSSLCFNGDALVVDVGAAAATPTKAAAAAARRSLGGRRINVGLPD